MQKNKNRFFFFHSAYSPVMKTGARIVLSLFHIIYYFPYEK